jgi:chlorobactene glucosyltransferase
VTWLVPGVYLAFLVLVVYQYVRRGPLLNTYNPRSRGPLVSVIIPARNEAENIERCVRSVLATSYDPVEIIVVDDRSTDATASIVLGLEQGPEARGRLRLVRGAELPPGWFGKPWALVQGWRAARGDLLLMIDADTRQTADLIGRSVAALETERVDLLSVLSHQEMLTFWERLVQPHVFLALASRVNDLRKINRTRVVWDAIASGQFILTPRAVYEAVGTHEVVRDSVAEDMALAQIYVGRGLDIFLLHGPEFLTTRMYRTFRDIVEGWSKNLATGVPLMMPPSRLLRRAAPYIMWMPALVWIAPPLMWALTGWPWTLATVIISLFLWGVMYWAEGAPVIYALLYPVGAMIVAYIMMRSAWRGNRRIEWRGRVYKGL